MAAQIKLIIKGEQDDALIALTTRGIKAKVKHTSRPFNRMPETHAIAETDQLAAIADWYAEDSKMVKGKGYVEGTLTMYTFVSEKANGEAA